MDSSDSPISDNLMRRDPSLKLQSPLYLGFVTAEGIPTGVVFTAKFPGYTDLDRKSLLQVLSSKQLGGNGPQSLFMKTWAAGLAYTSGVGSDVDSQLLQYYADRVTDLPGLMQLITSVVHGSENLSHKEIADYVMAQTFEAPRAMLSFSARGHEFAVDLRDGNTPERVRGFFEQILKLRRDPDLAEELIKTRLQAISPVLLADGDAQEKDAARSIFFFLGPEAVLSRAARQLAIDMVEMWPSDYWVN